MATNPNACPPPPSPPPFFHELGKNARGIFARGFNMGTVSLNFRSSAPKTGLIFGSNVNHNLADGKIFGTTELRFNYPLQRLNYVQKWNSNNEVISEISGSDVLMPGLGFGVTSLWAPSTGDYNLASKFMYAQPFVAATWETDVFKSKNLGGSLVLGYEGMNVGVAGSYAMEKKELEKVQYGASYDTPTFSLFTTRLNSKETIGGLYFRPSGCFETGIAFRHEASDKEDESGVSTLGVATRVTLDQNTMVGAKIDTNGKLMTTYEQRVGTVMLTFSSAVDMNNLDSGAHKVGLAISLET